MGKQKQGKLNTSQRKRHYNAHNKEIAKMRGEKHRKNAMLGKEAAKYSPTKLRILRIRRALSQKDMIEGTDINAVSTYGQIEMGRSKVRKERAEQLANKLGITHTRIFRKSGKNKYIAIF